ncbi:hypothetical protein [Amycolatopsis sp. 195334CR]|uniref:hypothetical protein n=1 Tax=Amycolatopsis sp. 195334CR TaxID=2814588 RepID=UPI001A90033C|nr:hypothetical protein [Amycolatopsis sp. 195334CR]MBN6039419.1 hypothetical protein [Amycolatopsis sp. 195334CR]
MGNFYERDHRDWTGGPVDARRREGVRSLPGRFAATGEELRLTVPGRWSLLVAPDGEVLAYDGPVASLPPGADPVAWVREVAGEPVVERVRRVVLPEPRGPLFARGPGFTAELDRYGLLRHTGELDVEPDLFDRLRARPGVELTEGWVLKPGETVRKQSQLGVDASRGTVDAPRLPEPAGERRVAPPGREVLISMHERGSTRWTVHVGANGEFDGPLPGDGFAEAPEAWARAEAARLRDAEFWTSVQEVGRFRIPPPGAEIAARVGEYVLEFARIGVTAAGEVTVLGRYGHEVTALMRESAAFAGDPAHWLRYLPEHLVDAGSANFRPAHDHLLLTHRR